MHAYTCLHAKSVFASRVVDCIGVGLGEPATKNNKHYHVDTAYMHTKQLIGYSYMPDNSNIGFSVISKCSGDSTVLHESKEAVYNKKNIYIYM